MPARNSISNYGTVARTLHWATTVLIIALFVLGKYMLDLPQGSDAEVARKIWFYSLHKTFGILAFALAVIRLLWALSNAKPHPLNTAKPAQIFVAETVHWMLYAGILITPLAGYLHHLGSAGGADVWLPIPHSLPFIPQTLSFSQLSGILHFLSAALMAISIFLHVGGALFHAIFLKDDTLTRMIPVLKTRGSSLGEAAPETLPKLAAIAIYAAVLSIGAFALMDGPKDDDSAPVAELASENWDVDYDDSLIEIQTQQMGDVVVGTFEDWSTSIAFYPDNLEASKITTEIELTSLDLGMATSQALSADFLNADAVKIATWTSTKISAIEPGRYMAEGALALNGLEVPVPLEFTLTIDGEDAIAEAIAEVDRNSFGIGKVAYPTEDSLGFMVRIRIVIKAEWDEP